MTAAQANAIIECVRKRRVFLGISVDEEIRRSEAKAQVYRRKAEADTRNTQRFEDLELMWSEHARELRTITI